MVREAARRPQLSAQERLNIKWKGFGGPDGGLVTHETIAGLLTAAVAVSQSPGEVNPMLAKSSLAGLTEEQILKRLLDPTDLRAQKEASDWFKDQMERLGYVEQAADKFKSGMEEVEIRIRACQEAMKMLAGGRVHHTVLSRSW